MMDPSTITTAREAEIVTVTLNRPDKGNAYDATMLKELDACFAALAEDPEVRVIGLRGNGRHFCTGADASGSKHRSESDVTFNQVLARLDNLPKPLIAVVHGGCVGGGMAIVACCDAVLALEDSFFAMSELRLGIAPSPRFAALITRAIGNRALRYYGLSGVRMTAGEAWNLGLVHQVVAADAVETKLEALVDSFLHNAPGALADFKQTLAEFANPSQEKLFPIERATPAGLERSAEAIEGLAAFREKRKPAWYRR